MATHDWHSIIDVQPILTNGVSVISVTWVNEVEGQKVQRTYTLSSPTLEGFKAQLRQTRDQLENTTPFLKEVQPGPIDIEPAPPPDPTDEEKALKAFLESYTQLQSGLRKVSAGVIKSDDADLMKLLSNTQSLYKSIYLGIG